jgi:PKHD-type hydroxylase
MWGIDFDRVNNWAYAEKVFTEEECSQIINFCLTKKQEKGLINLNDNTDIDTIRKNRIVWIEETNNELHFVYQKLTNFIVDVNNNFFNFDLYGFTEDIQFTIYDNKKDHYDWHIDKILGNQIRKLSIIVQLSKESDYEGCDFECKFGTNSDILSKSQGTVIAFPSYVLHKVNPLKKGKRYSLVAWIGGPNFK